MDQNVKLINSLLALLSFTYSYIACFQTTYLGRVKYSSAKFLKGKQIDKEKAAGLIMDPMQIAQQGQQELMNPDGAGGAGLLIFLTPPSFKTATLFINELSGSA